MILITETDEVHLLNDEDERVDDTLAHLAAVEIWIEVEYEHTDEIDLLDEIYLLVQGHLIVYEK